MQKIKLYLILLTVLLALSLVAFFWLTKAHAPDRFGNVLLFYFLITLAGFSFFTLIGFYLRKLFGQREYLNNYAHSASRQGLWLSAIAVISMMLLHSGLFSWINAGLLVMVFVFLESFLLTGNKNNS